MTDFIPWILLILMVGYHLRYRQTRASSHASVLKYLSSNSLLDLLNLGSIGVVISTPDRVIIHASAGFCQLLGYSEQEILGKTWAELTHPKDQTPNQQLYLEFLSGQRASYRISKGYRHKDGHRVETTVVITSARTASNTIGHIIAFVLDNSELHSKQTDLEQALKKLEKADKDRMGFVASLSHEVKTPITVIMGYCELILEQTKEPLHREYLQSALSSGRLLVQVVQDFMDLGKLDAGKLRLNPQPVDLTKLVGELFLAFSDRAKARGLNLELNWIPPVEPAVIIDPHRMRQILYNLIDNSLKFTLAGSVSLTIATSKTSEDQAAIELKVRDTGVGIPDSEIFRVFEPYEQLSSASAPNCFGTGLGLAVTRRLCELMGGRIQVESSVGVGSQFTVIIPAALAGSSLEVSGDTGHSSSTASKSGRNG